MKPTIYEFIILCLLALTISLSTVAIVKSNRTAKRVDQLTEQVIELQKSIANTNKKILDKLDILEAHLALYDRAIETNQAFFYGVNGDIRFKDKRSK